MIATQDTFQHAAVLFQGHSAQLQRLLALGTSQVRQMRSVHLSTPIGSLLPAAFCINADIRLGDQPPVEAAGGCACGRTHAGPLRGIIQQTLRRGGHPPRIARFTH